MTIANMTTVNMSDSKAITATPVVIYKSGEKREAGRMKTYWLGRLVSKLDSVLNLIDDALLELFHIGFAHQARV